MSYNFRISNKKNIIEQIDEMRNYFVQHRYPEFPHPILGIRTLEYFQEPMRPLLAESFIQNVIDFCKNNDEKYVVGSAALFIYMFRKGFYDDEFYPGDVDICTFKDYPVTNKIRDVSVHNKFYEHFKFQLIKKDDCETVQDFVSNFDIGCCKIIFNVETDSFDETDPQIIEAIDNKKVLYFPQSFNYENGKLKKFALARIIKYLYRGFEVGDFELDDMVHKFNECIVDSKEEGFYNIENWDLCKNKFSTIYRKLLEHGKGYEAEFFFKTMSEIVPGTFEKKDLYIRELSAKRYPIDYFPKSPLTELLSKLSGIEEIKISGSSILSLFSDFQPNDIDIYYTINPTVDRIFLKLPKTQIDLEDLPIPHEKFSIIHDQLEELAKEYLTNDLISKVKKALGVEDHDHEENMYNQRVIKFQYRDFQIQMIRCGEEIENFDMDFCKAFYHKGEIVLYPEVLKAIRTKTSSYKPRVHNFEERKLNELSKVRVNKYIQRGFKLMWKGKELQDVSIVAL